MVRVLTSNAIDCELEHVNIISKSYQYKFSILDAYLYSIYGQYMFVCFCYLHIQQLSACFCIENMCISVAYVDTTSVIVAYMAVWAVDALWYKRV